MEVSVESVRDVGAAGVDNHNNIRRLQGDGAYHEAGHARVKTRPTSKIYLKPCFDTVETHNRVTIPATSMKNDSSNGKLILLD